MRDAGIAFRWLRRRQITSADWYFFDRCYARTYREHHSTPLPEPGFFHAPRPTTCRRTVLLVIAERAAGRSRRAQHASTGTARSTAATGARSSTSRCLHFETCYYQAIEYCIAAASSASKAAPRASTSSRAAPAGGNRTRRTGSRTAAFRQRDRGYSARKRGHRALRRRAQRAQSLHSPGGGRLI